MTKPYYVKTIALTEEEYLLVEAVRLQGNSIKAIFLAGLDLLAKTVSDEDLQKAKALVK